MRPIAYAENKGASARVSEVTEGVIQYEDEKS